MIHVPKETYITEGGGGGGGGGHPPDLERKFFFSIDNATYTAATVSYNGPSHSLCKKKVVSASRSVQEGAHSPPAPSPLQWPSAT